MPQKTLSSLAIYALIFLSLGGAINFGLLKWLGTERIAPPTPWVVTTSTPLREIPSLPAKAAYYGLHREEFDLLFLGDSRTYCGMDAEGIDALLGTRSLNFANWAHWFSTQYPQYEDLLPLIPPDTVVVWSIGATYNFERFGAGRINRQYLLHFGDVGQYLAWGYSWADLEDNLAATMENEKAKRLSWWPAYLQSGAIAAKLKRMLPQPTPPPTAPGPLAYQAEFDAIKSRYEGSPHVSSVTPTVDGNEITSAMVQKVRGNGYRIEIDRNYFREKQRGLAGTAKKENFEAESEYWNNFVAILDLFEKHKIRLVVNEVEEAPLIYSSPEIREGYRAFMRRVESYVRQRGFAYTRVDWNQFRSDDFFDFNHLNSEGIAKYVPMIADQLRPHVDAAKRRSGGMLVNRRGAE